jgi:ZIP family zinc transporter
MPSASPSASRSGRSSGGAPPAIDLPASAATVAHTLDLTLLVLLYSTVAAAAATLGAVPLVWRARPSVRWIGWANALAAGLMIGAAYALMVVGLVKIPWSGIVGALLGVVFVNRTHSASGTADLDLNRLEETTPEYGYQVLLINILHSAAEGIAIGVAMAVSLPFGIFMALAIAVHNVPEAMVLCAILTARGVSLRDAAMLAVASNVSQILLAIVAFALVTAAPLLLPWALGFAVGALIYLVMAELLPECYRQAGRTSIAVVTIVAMGIVLLLVSLGA